nr:nero [Cucujiformia]
YCFGQMQDTNAVEILISVLKNPKQEPMVRHEAAEALGAIGSERAIDVLEKFKNDSAIEVAETCQLALERINWLKCSNGNVNILNSPYNSVDPAPPYINYDTDELKNILFDDKLLLFDRYRAMFALRNLGTQSSVKILGEALKCGSALFRHEVAFVLGQMQHKDGVSYLKKSLEDVEENEMVRHECAE